MNEYIKRKVVSIELAKKLKENDFDIQTEKIFIEISDNFVIIDRSYYDILRSRQLSKALHNKIYPAYDIPELLRLLPKKFNCYDEDEGEELVYQLIIYLEQNCVGYYSFDFDGTPSESIEIHKDTLVNDLAELLLRVKELKPELFGNS